MAFLGRKLPVPIILLFMDSFVYLMDLFTGYSAMKWALNNQSIGGDNYGANKKTQPVSSRLRL
jgi:hypothetical protein